MTDTIAAEWHKLRTARPLRYIVGVMAMFSALLLGLAWYFVATWDGLAPDARAHAALGSLPELLGWVASLCMAVFGALAITTEHSSRMISTTFLAMPSRSTVLAAKALLVAAVSFIVAEVALAVTLLGSAWIIAGRPITGQDPVGPGSVVLVLALGLSTAVFALIGLGLGAITRSALASVVALMLLWYIVPLIAGHAPQPWGEWLMSVMPGALAGELAGTGNADSIFRATLSPLGAVAVMLAYTVVPVGMAMAVVGRRDV